ADLVLTTYEGRGRSYAGRLLVYEGSPQGLTKKSTARVVSLDIQKGALMAVGAAAGDVNGDGFGDLAVMFMAASAPPARSSAAVGSVQIYTGSKSGLGKRPLPLVGGLSAAALKHTGAAGDVNGDGHPDVVVAEEEGLLLFAGGIGGPAG